MLHATMALQVGAGTTVCTRPRYSPGRQPISTRLLDLAVRTYVVLSDLNASAEGRF